MLEDFGPQSIVWDTCDQVIENDIVISPADHEGRGILLTVIDGFTTVDLTGVRVYLAWRHTLTRSRGTFEFDAVDAAAGTFKILYPDAMQAAEGDIDAQIMLSFADGHTIGSRTFAITCEKVLVGGEEASTEASMFVQAVKKYEAAIKVTEDAADAANAAAALAAAAKDEILADKDAGLFDADDGKDGADGKDGEDSKDGTDGADGVSCTHSWDGTVLTVTSASGMSSADLQGPQGVQGIQGVTGATGPQGPQGEKGEKGDTGDAGSQGETGPAGPKGDTGLQGPAGSGGTSATIEVGTVSTGAVPSVVNAGTSSAAIFNFVFPTGEGGDPMNVKIIEHVGATDAMMPYVSGSLVGVHYYVSGTNQLYEWDGDSWEPSLVDNWGSDQVRTISNADSDGYVSLALYSQKATLRQADLPSPIYDSSTSAYGTTDTSKYLKAIDLRGCGACIFGASTSLNDAVFSGLTNCQQFLLSVNCTINFYYMFGSLNSGGGSTTSAIHERCLLGTTQPVLVVGGSVTDGSGSGITPRSAYEPSYCVADILFKDSDRTTPLEGTVLGGTLAFWLATRATYSSANLQPTYKDVLHLDCWGSFTASGTSTSSQSTSNIFVATGSRDCVYELGSAAVPVLQSDIDAWGRLSYWAKQSGSGRIILVLYTEGGERSSPCQRMLTPPTLS